MLDQLRRKQQFVRRLVLRTTGKGLWAFSWCAWSLEGRLVFPDGLVTLQRLVRDLLCAGFDGLDCNPH